MAEETHSAPQKALKINLDARKFGTFAEIGAGQEVARWFFHVGKAAGTVAKSISAYDMVISDSIYGAAGHYVSRQRLEAMLDHEFDRLVTHLAETRAKDTALFAFADTSATHTHSSTPTHAPSGSSWLGIRFQTEPGGPPSQIIIHAAMLDPITVGQQEALGRGDELLESVRAEDRAGWIHIRREQPAPSARNSESRWPLSEQRGSRSVWW